MTTFLFFGSIIRVLLLQVALWLWLCWPILCNKLHCAWCWRSVHLAHFYPESWSSTICTFHYQCILVQSAARRARRLAPQVAQVPQQEVTQ